MPTIVEFNKQYRITLPKDLIEEKGWKAGTKLRFVEDLQGNIFVKVIKPKKSKK
jgi:bifunctional DNA-binding transcriptional regulator/antitoxin component of YhaV-PrlF toxin-antitoxin module